MWNDILEKGIDPEVPVMVRQEGGNKQFAMGHRTSTISGILALIYNGKNFEWNGQTYLIKVTHWRYIVEEDYKK